MDIKDSSKIGSNCTTVSIDLVVGVLVLKEKAEDEAEFSAEV